MDRIGVREMADVAKVLTDLITYETSKRDANVAARLAEAEGISMVCAWKESAIALGRVAEHADLQFRHQILLLAAVATGTVAGSPPGSPKSVGSFSAPGVDGESMRTTNQLKSGRDADKIANADSTREDMWTRVCNGAFQPWQGDNVLMLGAWLV